MTSQQSPVLKRRHSKGRKRWPQHPNRRTAAHEPSRGSAEPRSFATRSACERCHAWQFRCYDSGKARRETAVIFIHQAETRDGVRVSRRDRKVGGKSNNRAKRFLREASRRSP
jgi:hypothetical protein